MRHLIDTAAAVADPLVADGSLQDRVGEVAEAARSEAEAVDRDGRFPHAAIAAARRTKLLSAPVPTELGGEGASLSDLADVSFAVARSCASAGMIVAMHYSALACLIRHAQASAWHRTLLRRVAWEECLLASSTTEGNEGGNVRSSAAPLVYDDGHVTLQRAATVMSYGAHADGIVTTARRSAESASSDQVLVVFMKEHYALTETRSWRTLGMRGTCSAGFAFEARGLDAQVVPTPYRTIHAQTMMPVSHLLWGSAWAGIAAASVSRAQAFVRASVRSAEGRMPPGASSLTKAVAMVESLRGRLKAALDDFERIRSEPAALETVGVQTAFNLLKVEMSEGAVAAVSMAMRACGLAGYREDGEFSIGRHLRDILSAPVMIHNERILSNLGSAALLCPTRSLSGAL